MDNPPGMHGLHETIFFVSPETTINGATNLLYSLVVGLQAKGWGPIVALPAQGELESEFIRAGVQVLIVPMVPLAPCDEAGRYRHEEFRAGLKDRTDRLAAAIALEGARWVVTHTMQVVEGALAARQGGAAHIWWPNTACDLQDDFQPLVDGPSFFATLTFLCDALLIDSKTSPASIARRFPGAKTQQIDADNLPEATERFERLLESLASASPVELLSDARFATKIAALAGATGKARAQSAASSAVEEVDAPIRELLNYSAWTPFTIPPNAEASIRPQISVCLPVYNGERHLRACVDSILAQSFTDFELVIVDDASTDGSRAIIEAYHDERIRYVPNEHNLGLIGNWNKCLQLSQGEYVCIFHQDDRMAPDNLARKAARLAASPQAGFVYSDALIIDEDGRQKFEHWFELPDPNADFVKPGRWFFDLMFTNMNLVCCPSVLARRECYEKLGGFDERLPFTGDMEMWMRMAVFYDAAYLAEPLVQYRMHVSNKTREYLDLNLVHLYLCKRMLLEKYPEQFDETYPPRLADDVAQRVFERAADLYLQGQYRPARQYINFLHKINAGSAGCGPIALYLSQLSGYIDLALLMERIGRTEAELHQARADIASYASSRSWRVTRPLRWMEGRFPVKSKFARWKAYRILKKSRFFDPAYYLRTYTDVRLSDSDPLAHFLAFGWIEGRNPGPLFDTGFYLEANPDVRNSGANPLVHFVQFGEREGRLPLPIVSRDFVDADPEDGFTTARKGLERVLELVEVQADSAGLLFLLQKWLDKNEYYQLLDDLFTLEKFLSHYNEQAKVYPLVQTNALPAVANPQHRRQILFITSLFPSPYHGGGNRVLNFIKILSQNNDVYLYTSFHAQEDAGAVPEVAPYCKEMRLVSDWRLFCSEDEISAWLNGKKMDIVHYEWPMAIKNYAAEYGDRHVFTYMEVVSLRLKIDLAFLKPLSQAWLDKLTQLIQYLRLELVDAAQMDARIAVTTKDGLFLQDLYPYQEYAVLNHGLTFDEFSLQDVEPEPNTLVFVGNYRHYPNVDALVFFFTQVWDRICSEIPDLRIYLVGPNAPDRLTNLASREGVVFTGGVPDIRPYIQKAAVGIAPLISGAGMRGKVIDYAAIHRTFVASSIAVTDLAFQDGRDFYLADSAEAFAQSIISLLKDRELARRMAASAFDTAKTYYDNYRLTDFLVRLYEHIEGRPE